MFLISTPFSTSDLVCVIAAIATLTPLVKALHKWHIDYRKTSKPSETTTARQKPISSGKPEGSRWSRLSHFEKGDIIIQILFYVTSVSSLLFLLSDSHSTHPATLREVALVGLLVSMIVTTSRMPNN